MLAVLAVMCCTLLEEMIVNGEGSVSPSLSLPPKALLATKSLSLLQGDKEETRPGQPYIVSNEMRKWRLTKL